MATNLYLQHVAAVFLRCIGFRKRHEAAEAFRSANEDSRAKQELKEAEFIASRYIPKALSTEALTSEVKKAIEAAGASSIKDVGKVMKAMAGVISAGLATSKTTMDIIRQLLPN